MPTNAEMAARLLGDSAGFFRRMGSSNIEIKAQMNENAELFEQMAALMRTDPEGAQGSIRYARLAGDMLRNAAKFYRSIGQQNEPLKEQLEMSAGIYERLAILVCDAPLGWMD